MRLVNFEKGRFWEGERLGTTVTTRTGRLLGKATQWERDYGDEWKAGNELEKKAMGQLRKGFVLRAEGPVRPGEPELIMHFAQYYTGAQGIAVAGDSLYLSRNTGQSSCEVLVLDAVSGEVRARHSLPRFDVWRIVPVPGENRLLLLIDHGVESLDLASGGCTTVVPANRTPSSLLEETAGSLLTLVGDRARVTDLASGEVLFEHTVVLPSCHGEGVAGALSNDGRRVALHHRRGRIEVHDMQGREDVKMIEGDFGRLRTMGFHPSRDLLFATEEYGDWRFRLFDLVKGADLGARFERREPNLEHVPPDRKFYQAAFDDDGGQLVVRHRSALVVLDLESGAEVGAVRPEFVVKGNGTGGFVFALFNSGEWVAVRTDYGVLGVYRLRSAREGRESRSRE